MVAWWDQAPEALVTTFSGVSRDRWPEPEVLDERLAPLHGLLEETARFLDDDRPDWKERARKERKWANEELRKAAELVPMSKPEGRALRERCMKATASNACWPLDALRDEFRQFGIETLVAGIESIDRKLAQSALRIAEADWLQRLLDDDEACRAVSRLETSLARNNGVLPPDQVTVFLHALRAAPVWITTAKSVQSVPTAPDLFDVVLVDEASQCTLTDLLHLINVALTRARHALFVVADLDFLRHQPLPSLLYRLAAYCRDVETLRETSEAELRLYSWMILQGWTPKVHPRIGDLEVDFTLLPSHPEDVAPLAIEVDGKPYHREDSATDKSRDAFLAARGFQVLRVSAREVNETPLTVIAEIERRLAD